MSIIRRLPDHLVNQIAAGEVIERPAAALKELIENSIDAGATQVAVSYRDGGRSYLSVDDDGAGMDAESLSLAVERHATSKLPEGRLDQINTMGFRGEALPSIGAVSRLALTSRAENDNGNAHGWKLSVEGGAKSAPEPAARTRGTLVEVRDLFFATPARLKFLKSPRTESGHIADALDRLALAFPQVGFSLQDDARSVLTYGISQSADGRVADIMGKDFLDNAIPVDAARDNMRLTGWAGLPTQHKATAAAQYFYINNRAVKDRILSNAIRAAYADVLPPGRYPALVLYLEIDPALIDVNVHPAKTEVRFQDGGSVREFVVNALRQALSGNRGAAPAPFLQWRRPGASHYSANAISLNGTLQAPHNIYQPGTLQSAGHSQNDFQFAPSVRAAGEPEQEDAQNHLLGTALFQLHDNYILARSSAGLVIVDQHAAHERLVYEKIKTGMEGKSIERQGLLIPAVIDLPRRERDALIARQDELDQMGLGLEAFGQGALLVREVPAMLGKIDIQQMIKDLATEILTYDSATPLQEKLYHICATMACYNSVRSGRRLNTDEMNALLRQIEQTPNAQTCNHGRPTYFVMTEIDMEKLFKRR